MSSLHVIAVSVLLIPFSIFRGHYAICWTVLTSGQLGSQVLSTGADKVFEKARLMNPKHNPFGARSHLSALGHNLQVLWIWFLFSC